MMSLSALALSSWLTLKVVLLAGGLSPEANDHSHYVHLVSLRDTLEELGVKGRDVAIFWADGEDEALDRRLPEPPPDPLEWATSATPWHQWFERPVVLSDTRWSSPHLYPARRAALSAHFKQLATTLKRGDRLLIAVTDHGRPDPQGGWRTSVALWGEELSVPQLYEDLKVLPKGVHVQLWMSQCFSGGFASLSTLDPRVCGAFSAEAQRPAYGCFTPVRGRASAQKKGDGELRGHFMNMVKGLKRTGRLDQASDATMEWDDTPDTPHLSSDAFVQRLAKERAEALGVPVSHLVDAALPSPLKLSEEQRAWAERVSRVSLRYRLGAVHSYSKAHALLTEVQTLQYALSAWHAKWSQLTQEAKLRLLSDAPVDGAPPKEISRRRRGQLRLKRWLKRMLRKGGEGRRGLLHDLHQRQLKSERLLDQLYVLEAVALRLKALYTRLAAHRLLNAQDRELWRRIRRCESTPIFDQLAKSPRRRELLDLSSVNEALLPLNELRAEVESLRPGSLGARLHERSGGKLAEVVDVGYGSPAWVYGLKAGDLITSADGRRLKYEGQLREQIALYPVGEAITLKRKRPQGSEAHTRRERLLHVPVVGAPLSPPPPQRGEQVPPLQLEPIFEGESIDYLFTGGRPTLLFFWATWCKACLEATPTIRSWAKRHDIQVLAITSEDPHFVRALMRPDSLPFPSLYDLGREASRLFHVDLQRAQAPIFVYLDVEQRLIEQGVGLGARGPAQIEGLFNER